MALHEFRSDPHIISFLFLALIFFMLTRAPLASAQEFSGDLLPNVTPERSGEISGTVYVDNGAVPAGQIIVTIRSLSLGTSRSILSDFDGSFRVRGLAPGTYQVSAEARGYYPSDATVQVGPFRSDLSLRLTSSHIGSSSVGGRSISVRELKIPAKAREEYQRGIASLIKQDAAASVAHLNKAIQIFPGYYEAYYHVGVAETRLNHKDEAMDAFQKAIDVSGGRYALAQFAYGLLLSDRGKLEEGERIIRSGLETDPNSPEGHFFLAISLYTMNRLDEAEKSTREALVRRPNFVNAYLVLSDIHAKRSEYTLQLQDIDSFLKLAPSAPQAQRIREIREVVERLAAASSLVN